MTRPSRMKMPMRARRLASLLAIAFGLTVGLTATPSFAQDEPPPVEGEGDKSGRPFDGYMATGCLVGLAMFIVGKTARRN